MIKGLKQTVSKMVQDRDIVITKVETGQCRQPDTAKMQTPPYKEHLSWSRRFAYK